MGVNAKCVLVGKYYAMIVIKIKIKMIHIKIKVNKDKDIDKDDKDKDKNKDLHFLIVISMLYICRQNSLEYNEIVAAFLSQL